MSRMQDPKTWTEGGGEARCRTPAWLVHAMLPHLLAQEMLDERGVPVAITPEACRRIGRYILDLGCGDGAIAEVLADEGYPVIGIDNRAESLDRIPQRWTGNPGDRLAAGVTTIEADVLDPLVIIRLVAAHGWPAAVVMNPPFMLGDRKAFALYDPANDGVRAFIEVARRLMDPGEWLYRVASGAGSDAVASALASGSTPLSVPPGVKIEEVRRPVMGGPIFALCRCAWWHEIEGRDAYRAELRRTNEITMLSSSRRPGFYPDQPRKTDSTAYCWLEMVPSVTQEGRATRQIPLVVEPTPKRLKRKGMKYKKATAAGSGSLAAGEPQ